MNREQQIEEIKALNLLLEDITVDMVLFKRDGEAIDVITIPDVDGRVTNQLANILYAKGYRKASEVADELINAALSKIQIMISAIKAQEECGNVTEFNGGAKTALEIVFKDIAELKKIDLVNDATVISGMVEVDDISEKIIRKKAKVSDYWQNDVKQYRAMQGYSDIEHDTDNFLRGYNEAVEDILAILDGTSKERGGEK